LIELNNFRVEFGYEMIALYPYAYYLHKQKGDISVTTNDGMQPFYYFAKEIKLHDQPRNWYFDKENDITGVELLAKQGCKNAFIHKKEIDLSEFAVPNLKSIFKNGIYAKNSVVVINRYNNEWSGIPELNRPLNFFSLEILDKIFRKLADSPIYYINIHKFDRLNDGAEIFDLGDYEFCKDYSNVVHIRDIVKNDDPMIFNHVQLGIMSNATLFITMNGGGSILSSYFGGRNIIYTNPTNLNGRIYPKECQCEDFNYYHHFGGSEIIHVNTYQEILNNI
jgi:hypothetical protein